MLSRPVALFIVFVLCCIFIVFYKNQPLTCIFFNDYFWFDCFSWLLFFFQNIGFGMYNDQPPPYKSKKTDKGHTKGKMSLDNASTHPAPHPHPHTSPHISHSVQATLTFPLFDHSNYGRADQGWLRQMFIQKHTRPPPIYHLHKQYLARSEKPVHLVCRWCHHHVLRQIQWG